MMVAYELMFDELKWSDSWVLHGSNISSFQVEIAEVESGGSGSACWRVRERGICFVIEV